MLRASTVSRDPIIASVAPGLPSELLTARPDIRGAEHRLRARNADIGAARAAFFPRISLTGAVGSASDSFSGLYNAGTRTWAFVPQISVPFFDGGRNRANLDLAKARADIAVAEYERHIQVAFREVADALAAQETLSRERSALDAVVQSSQNATSLAESRYRAGLDSYPRYLDVQRTLYSSEVAQIEANANHQIALVQLYRALGGTWRVAGGFAPVAPVDAGPRS